MKPHAIGCALLAALMLLLAPAAVQAQRPKGKEALQLFEHGKKLLKAGKAEQACRALEQSLEAEEAVNTFYQLGLCYETRDRYLEGHKYYLRAATMARTAGDQQRADVAQQQADKLKPKIPKLVVVVPPDSRVDGLVVERDGKAVASADWGKAVPVDPGEHTITAKAEGRADWSTKATASKTGGVSKVQIPKLDAEGSGAAGDAPPPPEGYGQDEGDTGPAPEQPPAATTERRSTGLWVAGIIGTGVGSLATLGGLAGIIATKADCSGCDVGGFAVLGGVGLLLLGGGITLWVIFDDEVPIEPAGGSEDAEEPAEQVSVMPLIGPTSLGLRVDF